MKTFMRRRCAAVVCAGIVTLIARVCPATTVYFNHPSVLYGVRSGSIEALDTVSGQTTLVSGLVNPSGLALDASGNLYFGNVLSGRQVDLYSVTADGALTSLGPAYDIAGSVRVGGWGFDVAISPTGELYFNRPAEIGGRSGSIEKRDLNGQIATVVSGLTNPSGLAFDSVGNLYFGNVADAQHISIHKLSPDGQLTYLAPAVNVSDRVFVGGWGFDLAVDADDNVYFNHPATYNAQYQLIEAGSIRMLTPDGSHATVVGGLRNPSGLAFADDGTLFFGNVFEVQHIELLGRTPDGELTHFGQVVNVTGTISGMTWGFDIAVPEPATLTLLSLSIPALLRRRQA